jgi:hypothetical protein
MHSDLGSQNLLGNLQCVPAAISKLVKPYERVPATLRLRVLGVPATAAIYLKGTSDHGKRMTCPQYRYYSTAYSYIDALRTCVYDQ